MDAKNSFKEEDFVKENVLFGIIGAFLFSLAGGIIYVLLSMVGFVAALSGLVGVVCAIKGYEIFSKKISKRGIIISVAIAGIVLILAWNLGFCIDMIDAYEMWFEQGEVDFVPTIFEYIPYAVYDLIVNPLYFADLLLGLIFGAIGCWSYVTNSLKKQKAIEEYKAAQQAQLQNANIGTADEDEN